MQYEVSDEQIVIRGNQLTIQDDHEECKITGEQGTAILRQDRASTLLEFSGNVKFTLSGMNFSGDTIVVDRNNNVDITGAATFFVQDNESDTLGNTTLSADRIQMQLGSGKILLSGNGKYSHQPKDGPITHFLADTIKLDITSGEIKIEGSER